MSKLETSQTQLKLEIEKPLNIVNDEMSVSNPEGFDPFLVNGLVTSRHLNRHRNKWATLLCYNCGDLVHFKQSCSDKFCPSCFALRARRVHRDASDLLNLMLTPKFITLTYGRHTLSWQLIRQLRQDLNRLLHRKRFRRAIDGGFYWIELGTIKSDMTCNIHIHIMAGADYIPFQALSDAWADITGYSWVNIQAIKDARTGAFYLKKYCAKPPKGEEINLDQRNQINAILKNVRMIQTFGDCSLPRSPSRCKLCGAISSFISIEHEIEPTIRDKLNQEEMSNWVRLQRKPIAEALDRWVNT